MNLAKKLFVDPQTGRLRSFWRGHLFLFDDKPPRTYSSGAGIRLLLIFVLLEGILGPRLSLLGWLGLPVPGGWIRIPLLFLLSLGLVRFFAKIELSQLGLYSWARWTTAERSYFVQVFLLANIVFSVLFIRRLEILWSHQALWGDALSIFAVELIWGFYQEFTYRGLLQTELVRRWGAMVGIWVSNLLYTFGPLHFYHFQSVRERPAHLLVFAATFAIGLFFAMVYRRSGNLWIVGIFHGIGDWYVGGLGRVVALVAR
ncbi:MAG: CPBP family intramembrane metalloprotease [Acidobacteria bacterium]|nr:CPBP family intramembrane metalloprotease [Acidobacteriota bacterium]